MDTPEWPVALLLLHLFGSAPSSPVLIYTPTAPLPLQISTPSPSQTLPSQLSSSESIPSPTSPLTGSSIESPPGNCPLTLSPSTLVVRFGDPLKANCSVQGMGFFGLGWNVPLEAPEFTMDHFLIWSVERMTNWSSKPVCFALSEIGGKCDIALSLIVYQSPNTVLITLVNHTGPMVEGNPYILQCTVQDVAPVESLTVTFYRGQRVLGQLQSNTSTEKTPVTESFTIEIIAKGEDNGNQYWCEARLELGPEGPQEPPLVKSQKLTAWVYFGPQLLCPAKLQVREGEPLECEVKGNPKPSFTWFRDGQVVSLPPQVSREYTGKYRIQAEGLVQRNFTVELVVLPNSGTVSSYSWHFLSAVLLNLMIYHV
ncbi:intercellular adhesion molecule 1-like [Pholidichthys leucotaenia]